MADRAPDEPLDYRVRYLQLRSVLYDRVTGLPAWPVLLGRLRALLDARRRIGVVSVELVNLETVESLYGWQVVDRLAGRAAAALSGALGRELPQGALLAQPRVAATGFVVFVPHQADGAVVTGEYLASLARELCGLVESSLVAPGEAPPGPPLSARAGAACLAVDPFQRFERSVQAAIDRARGQDERRERLRELSWGDELRAIIRTGAVRAVFQPVVALDGGELLGHEAFVRGPRDSMFETPRTMFALSGRVGVAAELDRLCCEAVLAAGARLVHRGKIFVNVLPGTFAPGDWRDEKLPALLRSLALSPDEVVLEVSERGLAAEGEPLGWLADCRERGFALAVDDVGTGSAGREAIASARPSYLKLDASLVRGIASEGLRRDLLDGLVDLAGDIEADVIAEGVEADSEARALRDAGARYGQGFFYAAPSSTGALPAAARDC